MKFGISPFGIWRPGNPPGIRAGVDQYADLYADARKWLREGWCDYMAPQLYWPIKQTAQSYPVLLKWWMDQDPMGRHLWPGNYTSRTGPSEGNWPASEVVDQVGVTRDQHADGNIHFSMKAFLENWHGVRDALRNGPYASPALVPASPWLGERTPEAPRVEVRQDEPGHWDATWKPLGRDAVRFYEVALEVNGVWQTPSVFSSTNLSVVTAPGQATRIAVFAIDRVGNEGPATITSLAQ